MDDWALRKGHAYGTVLVDLDRRRPVALLPDREAGTLAAWLRGHPGVEVIARDRAGAYAKGARDGAPGAAQVADRFHLLQNLAEALEVVFTSHAKDLRAVEQVRREAEAAERGGVPIPPAPPQAQTRVLTAASRDRRVAAHGRVWALRREGWSKAAIARHLGLGRSAVSRHLRADTFPERKRRRDGGRSLLDRWRHVVLECWNGGRRNGRELFQELRKRGYRGSYPTLARYLQRLRAADGTAAPHTPRSPRPRPVLDTAPRTPPTPRAVAWSVLRPVALRRHHSVGSPSAMAAKRSAEDESLLADLRRHSPDLDETVALAEESIGLVRDRAPARLDPWLKRAGNSAVRRMRGFAERLSLDRDAVRAAVSLDWSNGQTEGQINRLEALKRQMYGRAGLDLLERRFLLAA